MNASHLVLNNTAKRNSWIGRCAGGLAVLFILILGQDFALLAQTPAKEYIRAGDRIIAFENPSAPPVISLVSAGSITTSGATITWTTDKSADSQVDYGTTTSYGSSTTLNTTPVTSHSQALTGLSNGTLYHYRVKSRDSLNNLTTSGDNTFTTGDVAPVISAVTASAITVSGATITWTTDKASDSQVDYGTTTSYGSSTTLNTTLVTSHSQALSGLASSTLYHYRAKSKDSLGTLGTSGDNTFTTASPTYTISGNISRTGGPLGGITILVNNVATTTSDLNGNYNIPNLAAGGSYIVAPSSATYIFSPGSQTAQPLNANTVFNFFGFPGNSGTYMNPTAGSGNSSQFFFQTAPVSSYPEIQILYGPSNASTAHACYVDWGLGGNNQSEMLLGNDAGTGWVPPAPAAYFPLTTAPHSGSWFEYYNSQCVLDMYNSYYIPITSQTLDWYVGLYFFASFGGSQQVWVKVGSGAWLQTGNWGVPNPAVTDATLAVTYPTNGGTVTKNVAFNLTGTVSWKGAVGTVGVFIDGGPRGAATINGTNFSYQTSVGAGAHQIAVATIQNQSLGTVVTLTVTGQ